MSPPGHMVSQPVSHNGHSPDVCPPQVPAFPLPCYECPHHTWTVPALKSSSNIDLSPGANVGMLISCDAWISIQAQSHELLTLMNLEAKSSQVHSSVFAAKQPRNATGQAHMTNVSDHSKRREGKAQIWNCPYLPPKPESHSLHPLSWPQPAMSLTFVPVPS